MGDLRRETDIVLYTDSTPNGQKASMTLEALGLKYTLEHVDINTDRQKEEWYLKINPNGRIPAIVDRTPTVDGKAQETRVFEGMAIQLYLVQKYGWDGRLSYPFNSDEYWEMVQWMTWLQSGLAPMQGQANHFYRYAPEKIQYGINRYQTETKRLYSVLERRLREQKAQTKLAGTDAGQTSNSDTDGVEGPWVVGNKMTIADINLVSWVNWGPWAGIELEPFPEVKQWASKISAIPSIRKGLDTPKKFDLQAQLANAVADAKKSAEWIMRGQKADHEKHGGGVGK